MANAITRFRNRKNLPATIDVPWPLPNPEIVFKVAPFSATERQGATWAAEKALSERGIAKPGEDDLVAKDEYQAELNGHFFAALADIVRKHVKGWVHTPSDGEPLTFSPAHCEQLFAEMSLGEKVALGLSYTGAFLAVEKKKEEGGASPPGSSNDSSGGSSLN